jgi:hypothetical protein
LSFLSFFLFFAFLFSSTPLTFLAVSDGDLASLPPINESYDVLAFHINVPIVVHENERAPPSFPILRGNAKYSSAHLSKGDRGAWSLPNGKPTTKSSVGLPPESHSSFTHATSNLSSSNHNAWFWLTNWQIDMSYPRVDADGWQYARSFDEPDPLWLPSSPTGAINWVRRRRWVRIMKRQFELDGKVASQFTPSLTNFEGLNYVDRAEALLNQMQPNATVSEKIARHKDAIEILKDGIKSMYNCTRKS